MSEADPQLLERPHISKWSSELATFAQANWDNALILADVLAELLFRRRKHAVALREEIVERLIELQRQSFPWPSTQADPGTALLNVNWPKQGLLAYMGYKTGLKGASEEARRSILDYVYTRNVPNVNSVEYMEAWGQPRSSTRLSKMAESLAAFVRNNKKKQDESLQLCIEEWEADLEYLRVRYYVGKYDFPWPKSTI